MVWNGFLLMTNRVSITPRSRLMIAELWLRLFKIVGPRKIEKFGVLELFNSFNNSKGIFNRCVWAGWRNQLLSIIRSSIWIILKQKCKCLPACVETIFGGCIFYFRQNRISINYIINLTTFKGDKIVQTGVKMEIIAVTGYDGWAAFRVCS